MDRQSCAYLLRDVLEVARDPLKVVLDEEVQQEIKILRSAVESRDWYTAARCEGRAQAWERVIPILERFIRTADEKR